MKKHLLLLGFIISSLSGFSQTLSGFFPNGMPGYKYTMQSQYYAHPLYAINDSTAGVDTAGFTVSSFVRNASNDSIILSFLNGRRLAVLAGAASTGGGGGTPGGATSQIQVNVNNAFTGYSTFTFTPNPIASGSYARSLYIDPGTLTTSANNDTLVGVEIKNPIYVALSPTNQRAALRVGGTTWLTGSYAGANLVQGATSTAFYMNTSLTGASIEAASFRPILTANANGSTLIGLKILPTFSNGGFTGVTQTSLSVNGNAVFGNDVSASTISSSSMISVNGTAVMIGQYSAPTVTFANGYGVMGTETSAGNYLTGTATNDMFIRSFQARPIWLGNSTYGAVMKVGSGVTYFTTTTTPSLPVAGSVVEWFDGTNKKWLKSDGSTGIIY